MIFSHPVAEIAQLVEQRPEKPCVPSSILGLGTIFLFIFHNFLEEMNRYSALAELNDG